VLKYVQKHKKNRIHITYMGNINFSIWYLYYIMVVLTFNLFFYADLNKKWNTVKSTVVK